MGDIIFKVKKKITETSKAITWVAHEGNVTLSAANGFVKQKGDEGEDLLIGPPPERSLSKQYFVKGWWTDENNQPITEALLGDVVKFHIETKNIPTGGAVYMTLYDDDRRIHPQTEDGENDKIELWREGKEVLYGSVNGNKIVRTILLNNIDQFIKQDPDGILELFFACSYKEEHVDLPVRTGDYLKVKGMPKIIFVNGHWKIASRAPLGENFGPVQPKKPYWVSGFANNARDYFNSEYNLKEKYTLNSNKLSVDELEKLNFILYYDGSSDYAFDQSGSDRFNSGRIFAGDNFEEIMKGLGKETIYLVSHSEGGAYAAGIAEYLFERGIQIGEHVLLSPDEGDEFSVNPEIPSYQLMYMYFASQYSLTPYLSPSEVGDIEVHFKKWGRYYAIVDWVVGEHKVQGVTKMGIAHVQDAGWAGVHGWTNGNSVFNIVADLKEVSCHDVHGERNGNFYAGKGQSGVTNNTKFYRIDDEYITVNCPPLIEIK